MLGAGLGLAVGTGAARRQWWAEGAAIDADFSNGRFYADGESHEDEAAWLTAIGGTRAGGRITIEPKIVGPELLTNPDFAAGGDGWAPVFGSEGVLSVVDGVLVDTVDGGGVSRFSTSWPGEVGKAYCYGGRPLAPAAYASGQIVASNYNLYSSISDLPVAGRDGEALRGHAAAQGATMYLGAVTDGPARSDRWDDFSVREVVPFAGYDKVLAGRIRGRTPAEAGAGKVLFLADDGATVQGAARHWNEVRLVWDAEGHLRMVVRFAGAEEANLDLGVVAGSRDFEIWFSAGEADFWAQLTGGRTATALAGTHPGLAFLRIGGGGDGAEWDRAIDRVTLFARPIHERGKLALWGDSLVAGLAPTLGARFTPARVVFNGGIGGEGIDTIVARMLADTAYRERIAVFWERNNSGVSNADYLAGIATMVARVRERHQRFVIISDINRADGSEEPGSAWREAQDERNGALASAYPGHFLDLVALLDDPELRADGLHLNASGMAVAGVALAAFIEAKGW